MNHALSAGQKTARAAILWTTLACVVILGLTVAMFVEDTGVIRYRGGSLRIPVSPGSVRVASDEGRASYVMLGHPDLANIFSRRGHAFGWGPGDQFGGAVVIPSVSDGNLQMIVTIEPKTRFFTRFDFRLRELHRTTGSGEKRRSMRPAGSSSSVGTMAEESGVPSQ